MVTVIAKPYALVRPESAMARYIMDGTADGYRGIRAHLRTCRCLYLTSRYKRIVTGAFRSLLGHPDDRRRRVGLKGNVAP